MMTEPNFDALTETQQRVLGEIAINQDGGHPLKTIKELLINGLIEKYKESSTGRFLTIIRYRVPLPIHIRWCEWCSTQVDDE